MEKNRLKKQLHNDPYTKFDKINGKHPWADQVTNGHIPYHVRKLDNGKVLYFNFHLAKEMGLISKDHPHQITKALEKKILSTFNIRIINEFDLKNNSVDKKEFSKNTYMASRYLQLQHKDKRGLTSGDGRGIWNGFIKHKGITWDISSRGTGVTCLAPGAVEAGQDLETGNEEFGYSCGLAEIDELVGTAIMSETVHNYGFETERMLTVIDFENGCGVGVRAGKNLIRPAHLFLHLKQNNYDSLKQATDYLIDRQISNKDWDFNTKSKNKYKYMLDTICNDFAKFAAKLEREYLFTWLDWDGDNVLANAGLIDYGSIRWLGLRHDKYRYDDVQRYSTTLNEQRVKAQGTVQVFAQLVDFLLTKEKKPLNSFRNNEVIDQFNKKFSSYLLKHFLFQIGFNDRQSDEILNTKSILIEKIYKNFSFFEKIKSTTGEQVVEDGINTPPILNMRLFLKNLPKIIKDTDGDLDSPLTESLIFNITSEFATEVDIANLENLEGKFNILIKDFTLLFKSLSKNILTNCISRSAIINRDDRVTGNAMVFIVQKLMKKNKNVKPFSFQKIIERLIQNQVLNPEQPAGRKMRLNSEEEKIINSLDNLIYMYREDL